MKNLKFLILIFVILIQVSRSDLQVYNDPELQEKVQKLNRQGQDIPFQLALFGNVPYGRKIIGEVGLANPIDACSTLQSTENNQQHTFILVQRGNCSFVTKVFNAQLFGGKIIILMDDRKEYADIIMSDDGMGERIIIPSIFIHYEYGDLLKSQLENKKKVVLQIEFEENKYKESDYIFWISLPSSTANKLIYQFNKQKFRLVGNKVNFEPAYDIYECLECRSEGFKKDLSDCILNGRFCANDPDEPNVGQITSKNIATGRNVVEESLRQLCIYNQNQEAWWDYMLLYAQECDKPQLYEDCSRLIVPQVKGIDAEALAKCFKDNSSNNNSPILKRQIFLQTEHKINTWPSITINDLVYRGNLDGYSIVEALCSSLEDPQEECSYIVDPLKQRPDESSSKKKSGSNVILIVLLMLFGFVVLFVLMACLYRRIFKKEMQQDMNNQINQMVSQYVAFYDQKKNQSQQSDL